MAIKGTCKKDELGQLATFDLLQTFQLTIVKSICETNRLAINFLFYYLFL
jgi:hypothetical protein